jgi:thiamine biosynthesis lipoprotein
VRTFELEAMGCDVVVGGGTIAERRAVVRLFAERDRVFSRFRPDSELTRVNASSGRLTAVSQIFARALGVALAAAEETGGLVDPTLGAAIEAAGYTRDFAELEPDDSPLGAASPGSWRSIVSGPGLVQVGRGVKLDLNGVVKAMAVDDALARLSGSAFVSAGGDLAAQGPLDVALPGGGSVRVVGGLATSGSARRNWLRSGGVQHHLIDPRSGRPAESPWSQVTVAGRTCLAADVAAKAAFLLGEEGPGWLDDRGLPGRFLDHAGEVLLGRAWAESLEREAACI